MQDKSTTTNELVSTNLFAILLFITATLLSSCANPLVNASPEQIRQYPTTQLTAFEIRHGKGFDPEVSQELTRRQQHDIDYLINNAKNLEDFEHIRYSFQTQTIASKIHDKYSGYIDANLFDDARRQWYIKTNTGISDETKKCIMKSKSQYDHQLKIGMTKDQVIAAIGKPDDINRSTGSWGTDEQWVYGGMVGGRYFPSKYFYFSDEKLKAIQD